VLATTDLEAAVKGVDFAVMVGGFPRKAGMERKDVMSKNVSIYQSQAAALEKGANKGVKVHISLNLPVSMSIRPHAFHHCKGEPLVHSSG
jgi:malate dehydrogenase